MNVFPRMAAGVTLALSLSSAAFAQRYEQVNLDANVSGAAEATDAQLVNGWALHEAPEVLGGSLTKPPAWLRSTTAPGPNRPQSHYYP